MTYTTEWFGENITSQTMLGLMAECQIFSVDPTPDGKFKILERCDDYFSADLTKEQVLALAQELIDLANGVCDE